MSSFNDHVYRQLTQGADKPKPTGIDWLVSKLESFIPPEMMGFVLAIGIVCAGLILFVLLKNLRPREGYVNKGARKRDAQKTRELALAAGFMADTIERDIPDISTDGNSYVITRGECQRYTLPRIMRSKAEWRLLCRPGDGADGVSVQGWKLEVYTGAVSDDFRNAIGNVALTLAKQGEFFEMEETHQALYFYWHEHGGRHAVDGMVDAVYLLSDMT